MLDRGELSFIFLWVLNPIVILFYQNCSSNPPVQAHATALERRAASVSVQHQASAGNSVQSCSLGLHVRSCAE